MLPFRPSWPSLRVLLWALALLVLPQCFVTRPLHLLDRARLVPLLSLPSSLVLLASLVQMGQPLPWLMLSRASQAFCAALMSHRPFVIRLVAQFGHLGVSLPFSLYDVSSNSLEWKSPGRISDQLPVFICVNNPGDDCRGRAA